METSLVPRLIRAVPPQLGTYIRPNRVDHKSLLTFLADGAPAGMDGIVFDPVLAAIHSDLLDETRERKIEAVLDTRAMEMALAGGFVGKRRTLLVHAKEYFLRRRCGEIRRLSALPETLRASRYMEEVLRPATDKMERAVTVEPQLKTTQQRLSLLRTVLGAALQEAPPTSFSAVPEGKRIQTRRGA